MTAPGRAQPVRAPAHCVVARLERAAAPPRCLSAISAPRGPKTPGAADANKEWNRGQPLAAGQAVGDLYLDGVLQQRPHTKFS